MNHLEAKLILQACRPGGQDAADPMFAEALAQVRRDPLLQQWFVQEQALDASVQAGLRQAMPIPSGLKARLLAQRKAVRPTAWATKPFCSGEKWLNRIGEKCSEPLRVTPLKNLPDINKPKPKQKLPE
jgi:hypothetical protein